MTSIPKTLGSFVDNVCQSLPSIHIDTPRNMAKKATALAIPAVLFFGAQLAQTAQAGPIAWAACIAICEATAAAATAATAGAAAPSLIACVTACSAILPLPFPP